MEEAVESAQGIADPEIGIADKSLEQSISSYNTDSKEASVEGALAIIYHENKETGQMEFYLETKSPSYSFREYQGKNALVGGVIDPTDKSPLEALVREIGEEISDEKAQAILVKAARENSKPSYAVESEDADGLLVRNYVFKLEIVKEEDWEIIRNSKMTNDAGSRTLLTRDDIAKSNNDDWAFNHYSMISSFINENYRAK